MRNIKGKLGVMSIPDLIQWIESSRRSGTLMLSQHTSHKKFYFQNGEMIFVWSDKEGERFWHYIEGETSLSVTELKEKFKDSGKLEIPLLSYILIEKLIDKDRLEFILTVILKTALTDALKWEAGIFEYVDFLPTEVLNGPIKISSSSVLMDSIVKFDETDQINSVNTDHIINEIMEHIRNGITLLPPIPDIMKQIFEKINDPNITVAEVVDKITDQLLIAKILKISNSTYFSRAENINTLHKAITYIGFKSLLSIVTIHSLSSFSPNNVNDIRKILRHSLLCGIIAKELAGYIGENRETAFLCGMLHDIGKTILIDLVGTYNITAEAKSAIIRENHAEIGFLLAKEWGFSDEIQEVIQWHHDPEKANTSDQLVNLIHLADMIANLGNNTDGMFPAFSALGLTQGNVMSIVSNLNQLTQEVTNIL
jgi:putative nucleotidyltransferase with HDIG domain